MYLDTSVLVKLFIREPDSEFYGNLADGRVVCSCVLAYTEFWSALLAKERAGGLDATFRMQSWEAFDRSVMEEFIELVPVAPAVFKRANRILEVCHPAIPLRSLDALHLASADQTQDWPLATHDQRMRDAATRLGFPLTPLPKVGGKP
ncbi:MAG TPA: type II toxin-antitoxin system VapC family toxin [Verrucomicrobiae bacterium]|jgi:predicted nucleic acid-binding protein|nr:type II toxin-antitoxin system VapC family toxin [Verrucomicrobiae bacterium]